jgi:hypothetical protein
MGTWCNGMTSASHAEGPGLESQWVHFVIHMPRSSRVAPELRARIPAALSCTSPLTQSLQPNVWHSDSIHIVAQALATPILKFLAMPIEMGRSLARSLSMPRATKMLMFSQHEHHQSKQTTALPNGKCPRKEE